MADASLVKEAVPWQVMAVRAGMTLPWLRCRSCVLSRVMKSRMAKVVGVSEYRVHAAIRRLVGSGLVNSEARYRDDGGRLANALSVTDAGKAFLVGIE